MKKAILLLLAACIAQAANLSGTITGQGTAVITVSLTGTASRTTTTAADGTYTVTNLVAGNYVVKPVKYGFGFNPVQTSVTVGTTDVTGIDFVAFPNRFAVYGNITGTTSPATTVSWTGSGTGSTTSLVPSGIWRQTEMVAGTYTFTPVLAGYVFTPASRTLTATSGTFNGLDFAASAAPPPTYNISGTITGTTGTTVTLSGASSASTTTNGSGQYTFSGLSNGSYTVTPTQTGFTFSPTSSPITISGANATANFAGTAVPPPGQETTFFNGATPGGIISSDAQSVTLGIRFYVDVPGTVKGVKFYKGAGNTGTHIGTLWSSTGTQLATVTFSNETATGWQQANFSTPVSISANTEYVVSYFAPVGTYVYDTFYNWAGLNATPLHISTGNNGVFKYGAAPAFPNEDWQHTNYAVDVVFNWTPAPTYTISGSVSGTDATVTLSGAASASTTTVSGQYSFTGLSNGTYVVAPSKTNYTFSPTTASVTLNGANASVATFVGTYVPPPPSHSVTLTWNASTSSVDGYKIYRAPSTGGPYTLQGTTATLSYVDSNVTAGATYYYVTTAYNTNGESVYSNEISATIPTP